MNHFFNLADYAEDDTVDDIAMESAYNALAMFDGGAEDTLEQMSTLISQEDRNLDALNMQLDLLIAQQEKLEALDVDKPLTYDEAMVIVSDINRAAYENILNPSQTGLGVTTQTLFQTEGDKFVLSMEKKEGRLKKIGGAIKKTFEKLWAAIKRIAYEWLNPRGRISRKLKALAVVDYDVEKAFTVNKSMAYVAEMRAGAYEIISDLPKAIEMVEKYVNHKDIVEVFDLLNRTAKNNDREAGRALGGKLVGVVLTDIVVRAAASVGFEGYVTKANKPAFRIPGCAVGLTVEVSRAMSVPFPLAVFSIISEFDDKKSKGESSLKECGYRSEGDCKKSAVRAMRAIDAIDKNTFDFSKMNPDGFIANMADKGGSVGIKHVLSVTRLYHVNMQFGMGIYRSIIEVMRAGVKKGDTKKLQTGTDRDGEVDSLKPSTASLPSTN